MVIFILIGVTMPISEPYLLPKCKCIYIPMDRGGCCNSEIHSVRIIRCPVQEAPLASCFFLDFRFDHRFDPVVIHR